MKKLKLKISPKKIIRYSYILVFVAAILILASTTTFLYRNFYQAIVQSEEVIKLKEEVAIETVNNSKFDQIIKAIDDKSSIKIDGDLKNIFY